MVNDYSTRWFTLFMQPIPPAQTEVEVDFIARHLPRPDYQAVLDLCCGTGRHARALAARGYRVAGVDHSTSAIAEARRMAGPGLTYIVGDMRDIRRIAELSGHVDAVLNLWQSFGYFDDATNHDILRQIGEKLRPGGRFVLDIYHRGFFEANQGTRTVEKKGVTTTEHKYMAGNRLTVKLTYGGGFAFDTFDWRLYTPEEIRGLAETCGLQCIVSCAGFDEQTSPSPAQPRMQLVFEKVV